MVECLKITVYGKVQGVHYRATAVEKAKQYGICGFARNEKNGTVYIEAEGEAQHLKEFTAWCHAGPEGAMVQKVVIEEGSPKGYKNFIIAHA